VILPAAAPRYSDLSISAVAVHVCADVATAGANRRWPPPAAAPDTVRRAARICQHVGIVDQRTLAGEHATRAAFLAALRDARAALANDGLFVLTFSGHTERGERPIGEARWCLFDGGLELSQIACELALFPEDARLVVICDTCYGAAITQTLLGPQQAVVVASCAEDQTMIGRRNSEFVVRLERFICSAQAQGSLDELRRVLESDTPDCERPCVWTNTESWWSAQAIATTRQPGNR
jgi:hypothetical protein